MRPGFPRVNAEEDVNALSALTNRNRDTDSF